MTGGAERAPEAPSRPGSPSPPGAPTARDGASLATGPPEAYLARVMAEIDEEARRRGHEIPARLERELDAMFLEHAPMGSRRGDVAAALRTLDAAVFIDPVVPIASQRPAGAVVKKGIRSLNLWYVGYVTRQVSQFAAAVSRTLHLVDTHLQEIQRALPPPTPAPVVAAGDPASWWGARAADALGDPPGRVLHAACGDGWLVRMLQARGVDSYGVDPRPGVAERHAGGRADLREEPFLEHLRAVGPFGLGGLVLSGVVEGQGAAERAELLAMLSTRLQDGATLVVHSLTPVAWARDDAPPEADLAPGRPLRPATWAHLLEGWAVDVFLGEGGDDYLVVARR